MNSKHTLSNEQLAVIKNNSKLLILSAGPGTGKTQTLIEYLNIKLTDYDSFKKIVVCSFTRNSSNEIKNRSMTILDDNKWDYCIFSTFDKFLIDKIWLFYFNRIIHSTQEDFRLKKSELKIQIMKLVYSKISWMKFFNNMKKKNEKWRAEEVAKFLNNSKEGILTLGHIAEYLLFNFIKKNIEVQKYLKNTYERIIVDEAQDLNKLRYAILHFMYHKLKIKITLIGDEKQTLYKFTGAAENILTNINKKWENSTFLELNKNWRYKNGVPNVRDISILELLKSKNESSLRKNLKKVLSENGIKIKDNLLLSIKDIPVEKNVLILFMSNAEVQEASLDFKRHNISVGASLSIRTIDGIDAEEEQIEFIENLFAYKLLREGIISMNSLKQAPVPIIYNYLWPYDPKSNDKFLKLLHNNQSSFKKIIDEIEKKWKIKIWKIWNILEKNNNYLTILQKKRIHLMTIHNSKGLEADYIIIKKQTIDDFINNISKKIEFETLYVAISRLKEQLILFK